MATASGKFIGQSKIINAINSQVASDKVSHAFLFCGNSGMGKRTLASLFASALLCEASHSNVYGACGQCVTCKMLSGGAAPDIRIVSPSKKTISVDDIRDVVDWVSVRPMYSSKKVYIIEDADQMTTQAQNALLKTLEEPPPYVVAIMTAAAPQSLLETVRSRCVIHKFVRYTDDEVAEILRLHSAEERSTPQFSQTEESAKSLLTKNGAVLKDAIFVKIADGIPGRAIEMLSTEDLLATRDHIINLLHGLVEGGATAFLRISEFFEKNKDDFGRISKILIYFLRDLWLYKSTKDENVLINLDKKGIIEELSGKCNPEIVLECIEEIENTCASISANSNYSLAINVMLLKFDMLANMKG